MGTKEERRRGGEVLKWGEREGRSTGPLLAEEMAFEWVCALRRMVGILEGRERRGRQAENYYAPLPLISFAWRVRKVQILSLLLAKKEEHLEGRKKEHLGAMSILLVTNLPSLSPSLFLMETEEGGACPPSAHLAAETQARRTSNTFLPSASSFVPRPPPS